MIQMAVLSVAAALTAGLTACDGLWVAADDGYYDGPDIDYNPYYGYWGGRGNNGYGPLWARAMCPHCPRRGLTDLRHHPSTIGP